MDRSESGSRDGQVAEPYEPPQLESVLAPEEIEREVHYAGVGTPDVDTLER